MSHVTATKTAVGASRAAMTAMRATGAAVTSSTRTSRTGHIHSSFSFIVFLLLLPKNISDF